MPTWTRANALLTMTSALSADVLIPISLSAHEAVSTPFQFVVEVVSQQGTITPDDVLHKPACVTLQSNGAAVRHFHGIVQSISAGGSVRGLGDADGYKFYRLVLVPRLWFMSQTVDCRVYENKSAADILTAMVNEIGQTDQSLPTATERPYTVQFNESDLHFATRLMEEEGWFYFFEHTDSTHKLIIAKDNTAFTAIPNGTLRIGGVNSDTNPAVTDFSKASATVLGKWAMADYDPENPTSQIKSEQPTTLSTDGHATRDGFRWPALTFDTGTVANRATFEIQATEAAATLFDGGTHFGGMVPGGTFVISSRPASSDDGTYAVRSVSHQARDESWINQGTPASYSNHFTCFLNAVVWRQPMSTRRPRMDGIHTALVMGPQSSAGADIQMQSGEEIHTDDLGRVKVRFFWDHRGEATGGNAVWARVIQPWAGNGWGAQFIPRVGTEVAVGFVDGDPDRPMVIGGLYNGAAHPVYAEADKTKLGFRTRSTLSGSKGSNFSEFTIDDKSGSELIFFHAEKDYTTEVENDQTLKVDNCRIVTIKKDETVEIQGKQAITVKGDQSLTVSQGNQSDTVSQGNYKMDVTAGNISIKAGAGKIEIEAMQSIVLKVGGNTVTIDQKGFSVDALMVDIKGSVKAQVASPLTTVKADGMLTLKGGVVMLN